MMALQTPILNKSAILVNDTLNIILKMTGTGQPQVGHTQKILVIIMKYWGVMFHPSDTGQLYMVTL